MSAGSDDQRFLITGAGQIGSYLESPVLFWPLQFESQPLTIGSLLLSQKKVAGLFHQGMPSEIRQAFDRIALEKSHSRASWQKKVQAETHSRLNQYRSLISDLEDGDEEGVDYSVIARLRAIIELLDDEVEDYVKVKGTLVSLDQRLRRFTTPADFIWPDVFQEEFDSRQFWFLYARLSK